MNDNLTDAAKAATSPAKANRRGIKLTKSTVDKERLKSAHEDTLDKPRASKPSRRSSNADARSNKGLLYVLLEAQDESFDLRKMPPKVFPNLVRLKLSIWPKFEVIPEADLLHYTCFVVPVEPWPLFDGGIEYSPLAIPCCEFLAASARGRVPMPCYVPSQIINGGFDGVLKTIEDMWPNARRVMVSKSSKTPAGWLPPSSVPGLR